MKKQKILVVEDESIIAEDLRLTLDEFGYAGKSVLTSEGAIQEVKQNKRPDLIVMDVHLKEDADGIETARSIQKLAKIPVLFISAFPPKVILSRIKGIFRAGYLEKPFTRKDFKAAIVGLLALA